MSHASGPLYQLYQQAKARFEHLTRALVTTFTAPGFVRWSKRGAVGLTVSCIAIAALLGGLWGGFVLYDRSSPPPLERLSMRSVEVVDKNGALLRAYVTEGGHFRLKADLDAIDGEFLRILLAFEDKRFWTHGGIDPLAMGRAFWQLTTNGRIISGGSTITMQLARLLEPRKKRSFGAKFRQMVRALQIEQRLSKREILEAYLTFAPYGGNLEGIRAASWAYFAKEPKALSLPEAALLVALPQSPEARRPDLRPRRATKARNRVLARMAGAGVIAPSEVARASAHAIERRRYPMPSLAAHASDHARRARPDLAVHHLTLDREIQARLEAMVKDHAAGLASKLSLALVLADAKSGAILAEIGSPDFVSQSRSGWVDMSRASRSPGSALKPFIYGLAFEEGLVRPETRIDDRPINFDGYRPKNFNMGYQGEVSIRDALLRSLNVPAVSLLDAVGPARLMNRLEQGNVDIRLPEDSAAGLAIGLGGLGMTLRDLTQLYTIFANAGRVKPLFNRLDDASDSSAQGAVPIKSVQGGRLLSPQATWMVGNILFDARPPEGASPLPIAYKTGTSYGYRDAWSVGFDGGHVLGVWVGRPDNSAVPGITGRTAAAPILFNGFAKAGLAASPVPPAPLGAKSLAYDALPPTLRKFAMAEHLLEDVGLPEASPRIHFPPDGARIELQRTHKGRILPLILKIQDGRPPFRWLANGQTIAASRHKRKISWSPDGAGHSTLTVIDAAGRAASVSVFLQHPEDG